MDFLTWPNNSNWAKRTSCPPVFFIHFTNFFSFFAWRPTRFNRLGKWEERHLKRTNPPPSSLKFQVGLTTTKQLRIVLLRLQLSRSLIVGGRSPTFSSRIKVGSLELSGGRKNRCGRLSPNKDRSFFLFQLLSRLV